MVNEIFLIGCHECTFKIIVYICLQDKNKHRAERMLIIKNINNLLFINQLIVCGDFKGNF